MEAKPKSPALNEITLRLGMAEEYGFVLSSSTRSFHAAGGYVGRKIQRPLAIKSHWKLIKHLLLGGSTLICATPKESGSNVLGYVLGDVDGKSVIIHYVYVKQDFRGLGIARHLIEAFFAHHGLPLAEDFFVTHMNSLVADFRSVQSLIYNPYLLMRGVSLGDAEREVG